MQSHLLEAASKVITTPQVLVNIISKRVRQLTQGHRPLVEVGPRMGFSDIALTEVIKRKLSYELASSVKSEAMPSKIVAFSVAAAEGKAA